MKKKSFRIAGVQAEIWTGTSQIQSSSANHYIGVDRYVV